MLNNKAVAFTVLLLALTPYALAEARTDLILVSDNHADLAVAEALAEENGATILKTPWGEYDEAVLDLVLERKPNEVTIIGGPMAVLPEYESRILDAGMKVERLWGKTRQQTSIAVFDHGRMLYAWDPALGDGYQPYRMPGMFPIWLYDNETEIDAFMMEHTPTVLGYGMMEGFMGKYGSPMMDVLPAEVEDFGMQMNDRIHSRYGNYTWVKRCLEVDPAMEMDMGCSGPGRMDGMDSGMGQGMGMG